MGTVSRVHTFASGAILTAAQLNNEFDNLLTSSAINGGLDATNLGVTAGQATASKALVVDASRNLADATGSNRINNLALSGTFESTGAVTASAGITSGGNIVSDTDSTDDLGTTGVRWANLFVDDVTVTNNVTIGGTLTLTGGITLNGNTTIGDSSADTLTVNSTITSNLIFTDATYDIGASGATRPRDLHLSRNAVMGGTLGVTGLITATGGVSGALTGDVTGNVTGGTISGTTATFSGVTTVGSAGATADFAVWTDGTSSTAAGFTVDASADEVIVGQLSGGGNTNFKVRNRLNNTVFQVTPDAPSTTVFAPNIATGSAGTLTVKTGSINSDSIRLEAGGTTSTWLESRGYLGHSWYVDSTRSMTLDSTGLGIGTASPTAPVDINTSGNTHLIFKYQDSSTQRSFIATNAGVSTNYNGLVIGSNATQQGTQANTGLSSWYQRLGPTDATGDAWSVAYQAAGGSVVERVRIDSSGTLLVGRTVPSSTVLGSELTPDGLFRAVGSSTSTNLAVSAGGRLNLANNSATDGNFSSIGGYNSNGLVTSQIDFINVSHSSRTGDIAFLTHTGASMPERLRITSAGNVGIGAVSPSTKLHVSGASSASALRLDETTSSANSYLGYIDTSGNFGIDVNGGGYLRFAVGGAERARILSSGGITFNGDTAAANALDDYEEGTWTPTIDGFTGTYGNQTGTYVKIGQLVHASCYVTLSSITSMDGTTLDVSGFPFATESSGAWYAGNFGNFGYIDLPAGTVQVGWNIGNGLTTSTCRAMKDNAAYEDVLNTAITSTSFFMYVSWTYRTA